MKNFLLLICVNYLICSGLIAQDFNNYTPLKSSGAIPEAFLSTVSSKIIGDNKDMDLNVGKKRKKQRENYLEGSNLFINNLLRSGTVLFGDPITEYLNKIADKLLKNDKELRSQIKIFAVKSHIINAYTTRQGIIFFNIGLVAQAENEAQIAFILAHEIVHFKEKHSLKVYLDEEDKKNERRFSRLNKSQIEEELLNSAKFSREQETESDKLGYEIYKKAGYRLSQASRSFKILARDHIPFKKKTTLPKEILGFSRDEIPDSIFKYKYRPEKVSEEDRKKATHPDLRLRVKQAKEWSQNKKIGKYYLVGKKKFRSVRNLARFELLAILLRKDHILKSYQTIYFLKKDFPESKYLAYAEAKWHHVVSLTLNQLSINSDFNYRNIDKSARMLYYIISNEDEVKIKGHCLLHLWKAYKKNKKDPFYKLLLTEAIESYEDSDGGDYFDYNDDDSENDEFEDDLYDDDYDEEFIEEYGNQFSQTTLNLLPDTTKTKTQKKRKTKKKKSSSKKKRKKTSKKQKSKKKKKVDPVAELLGSTEYQDFKLEMESTESTKFTGTDKFHTLPTLYYDIDSKRKTKVNAIKSEEARLRFNTYLDDNAKLLKMNTASMNLEDMVSTDVKKWNRVQLYRNYFNQLVFEDLDTKVGFDYKWIQEELKDEEVKYFMYSICLHETEKRSSKVAAVFFSLFIPALLPASISYSLQDKHTIVYLTHVVNLETGEKVFKDGAVLPYKATYGTLNSQLYYSLLKLKNGVNSDAD